MTAAQAPAAARPVRRAHVRGRGGIGRFVVLGGLGLLMVVILSPFAIVVINALKSPSEYASNGPLALPQGIYLQGIIDFWNRVDFGRKLLNSAVISGSVALLGVGLSLLSAYALGIGRMKGRMWVLVLFLIANALPHEALVYPLYYLAKVVHL